MDLTQVINTEAKPVPVKSVSGGNEYVTEIVIARVYPVTKTYTTPQYRYTIVRNKSNLHSIEVSFNDTTFANPITISPREHFIFNRESISTLSIRSRVAIAKTEIIRTNMIIDINSQKGTTQIDQYEMTHYPNTRVMAVGGNGQIWYTDDTSGDTVLKFTRNAFKTATHTYTFPYAIVAATKLQANSALLVCTGDYVSEGNNKIWRSTDLGLTFTDVTPLTGRFPWLYIGRGITENPRTGIVLYAEYTNMTVTSGDISIFRSADGGATWTQVHKYSYPWTINHFHQVVYDPKMYDVFYATTGDGHISSKWLTSVDAGLTWTEIPEAISEYDDYKSTALLVFDDYFMWATDNEHEQGKVFKCDRDSVGTREVLLTVTGTVFGLVQVDNRIFAITGQSSPWGYGNDQTRYAEVYVTSDYGKTWTKILEWPFYAINAPWNAGFCRIIGPDAFGGIWLMTMTNNLIGHWNGTYNGLNEFATTRSSTRISLEGNPIPSLAFPY